MDEYQNDNSTNTAVVDTPEPTIVLPNVLPTDIEELRNLRDRLDNANAPYGSGMFVKALTQYLYRQPLVDKAIMELNRSWKFINGHRGPGVANGAKKRSVRSRAHKFYDSLSEPAIRNHCTAFGLSYDSFDTVDARIEALVEKSVASSS